MNTLSRHSTPIRIGLALLAVAATYGCANSEITTSPEDLGLGQDRPVSLKDLAAQPPDVAMVVDFSMPDLYVPTDLFVACDGGLTPCSGACVDTQTSFEHCGMCGKACPGGWNCCGGTCSNPVDSIMNCGACGVVCQVAHGTPACMARMCSIASCDPGYADCVGGYKDGCETQTDVNVNNCGACNKACFFSHAQPACSGGKCGIDTCLGLWADCDGDLTNGCELDAGGDIKNCGKCGRVCPTPANATPASNGGMCGIGMCAIGFADCDGNGANGCEVNKNTDVKNCGGCGMVCPAPANATPGCGTGVCGIGMCSAGFADCDKNAGNGCEVNTTTDVKNCGGCGVACPALANATPGCGGGTCSVGMCAMGFADCDGISANGCEIDMRSDQQNCGRCGNTCQGLDLCVAGNCAICAALQPQGGGYAEVPDSIPLRLSNTSFTIEVWAYANNFATFCNNALVVKRGGAAQDGWFFSVLGDGCGGVRSALYFQQSGGNDPQIQSAPLAPIGTWFHAAVTRDNTNGTTTLFLDGKSVASKVLPALNAATNSVLRIAQDTSGQPYNWNGYLAQVRISKAVRYNANFAPAKYLASDVDTIALWNFDELNGPAIDRSGNGHDAKLVSAVRVGGQNYCR